MSVDRPVLELLKIVYRWTDELIPDPRNARTHSPRQIEQLRASYREFGFTNPILLRPNLMIGAGHARWQMAKAEGLEQVPTIMIAGLTEAQWDAYAIADNQLPLNAGWDMGLLSSALKAASGAGMDVALLGFQPSDLRRILGFGAGLTDPDAAVAIANQTVSHVGDVWQLGAHRVFCGDATAAADVHRLLGRERPPLMVSDPPYGVEYSPEWRKAAGVSSSSRIGAVANDDRADWREAWALFPGDVAYIWHAGKFAAEVKQSLAVCDFEVRAQIIWRKPRFAIGRGDYHWQHEPCWYAVRKGKASHWVGGRKQSTVWDIAGAHSDNPDSDENAFTVHGTQKPVECMRRPIENNSTAGDAIYDPFLGSGTTLIAAEQCERICYGLEIDPRYVDVIVRRWQGFTGKTAVLSDTGQSFEQLERERKSKPHGRERTKAKADRAAGAGRQQGKAGAPAE